MTLIGARRWRVELTALGCGRHYIVTVEPVAYIGKDEFKDRARAFRRLFMNLDRRWRWVRSFTSQTEARNFALGLAKFLAELAFVDNGQLYLTTPREGS